MNYCFFIVQIISQPKRKIFPTGFSLLEMNVWFSPLRKKKKKRKKKGGYQMRMVIWGKLGKYFLKQYVVGDFIIVRGFLSFKRSWHKKRIRKKPRLTAIKIYPFLLMDASEEE